METLLTSKQLATLLGIKPGRIAMALYDGRLSTPRKIGRAFLWGQDDAARVARLFGIKLSWPGPESPAAEPAPAAAKV